MSSEESSTEFFKTEQEKNAFHADNIGPAILITLTRLYDVQMATLAALDPEAALALAKAHEQGVLLAPPPAFIGE